MIEQDTLAAEVQADRRLILFAYARLNADAQTVRCAREGGKVIFDTTEDASLAAGELVKLGARPMQPYRHRNHWHLTSKGTR